MMPTNVTCLRTHDTGLMIRNISLLSEVIEILGEEAYLM